MQHFSISFVFRRYFNCFFWNVPLATIGVQFFFHEYIWSSRSILLLCKYCENRMQNVADLNLCLLRHNKNKNLSCIYLITCADECIRNVTAMQLPNWFQSVMNFIWISFKINSCIRLGPWQWYKCTMELNWFSAFQRSIQSGQVLLISVVLEF